MPAPIKLAHVVFQTNRIPELRDFWCGLLEGKVQFENEATCFICYDEEHHRVALLNLDTYQPLDRAKSGMHHVAFTYASLADLIGTYERLRDRNILPWWTIRHGPTLSMYYQDPDGNRAELQVDVYATAQEANEYMLGPEFGANPIGVEFDPEDLVAKFHAGAPEQELLVRPPQLA
jgi:catechol-2,3-dioxygenase